LRTTLGGVVEEDRKIIDLLDVEFTRDEDLRARCAAVGRRIYREKHELVGGMREALHESLLRASAGHFKESQPELEHVFDYLTLNQSVRGADALAFVDLADELLATVQEAERDARLKKTSVRVSLEGLNEEIKSIQGAYQKEISRIFSNLETRGKAQKREKW